VRQGAQTKRDGIEKFVEFANGTDKLNLSTKNSQNKKREGGSKECAAWKTGKKRGRGKSGKAVHTMECIEPQVGNNYQNRCAKRSWKTGMISALGVLRRKKETA